MTSFKQEPNILGYQSHPKAMACSDEQTTLVECLVSIQPDRVVCGTAALGHGVKPLLINMALTLMI